MRPDDLTVSEWADAHRWLSSRAAAPNRALSHGPRAYLRAIMDALSPNHPAQRINFMKAAQVGATEAGEQLDWLCHPPRAGADAGGAAHGRDGQAHVAGPDRPADRRRPGAEERVSPARSRDAGNSMLSKEFPGGILVLTGANSGHWPALDAARYVFLDEVDAYPASADEEGDPVTLAGQGPPPSRIGAGCSWSRRLRCGGCRASSGSSRPATSGATSCPAPVQSWASIATFLAYSGL